MMVNPSTSQIRKRVIVAENNHFANRFFGTDFLELAICHFVDFDPIRLFFISLTIALNSGISEIAQNIKTIFRHSHRMLEMGR